MIDFMNVIFEYRFLCDIAVFVKDALNPRYV